VGFRRRFGSLPSCAVAKSVAATFAHRCHLSAIRIDVSLLPGSQVNSAIRSHSAAQVHRKASGVRVVSSTHPHVRFVGRCTSKHNEIISRCTTIRAMRPATYFFATAPYRELGRGNRRAPRLSRATRGRHGLRWWQAIVRELRMSRSSWRSWWGSWFSSQGGYSRQGHSEVVASVNQCGMRRQRSTGLPQRSDIWRRTIALSAGLLDTLL
jgi:hypothetical protein